MFINPHGGIRVSSHTMKKDQNLLIMLIHPPIDLFKKHHDLFTVFSGVQ